MRKKRIVQVSILAALICALGLILWFASTDYRMERRIESAQLQIKQEFQHNKDIYAETASNILICAEQGDAQITYILQQGTLHTDYLGDEQKDVEAEAKRILRKFGEKTGFDWNSVDAYPKTHYTYPEKSCVFRYTIWNGKDVYCWVDLIYSPNWEEYIVKDHMVSRLQEGLAAKVDNNWYIVVLYGY